MPVAAKKTAAKTAAKKAAPKVADEPDLLAGLDDEAPATSATDDDEVLDLLEGLSEDTGTPWIPDDEDDPSPAGIQGRVTFLGTVASDYGPEECPLVELESADGTAWSIRGYATVLRNQINKAAPAVGDLMAVKYFGTVTNKSGKNEYKNFKVVVKRA